MTPIQDSAPQTFWHGLWQAFDAVGYSTPLIERSYQLDGHRLRLRFAGPALLNALGPALEHLQIESSAPPDLTISLWDSTSTGAATPARLPPPSEMGLRGELHPYSDTRFFAVAQTDVRALSMLDGEANQALYWTALAAHLPVYERAAPLKIILNAWLRGRGLPLIHAAAVGADAGAVLLVGATGTGKSTAALACLSAGMQYISDDRCALGLTPQPHALCIYNTAKLHHEQMQRFPHLAAAAQNGQPEDEKSLVLIHRYAPEQVAAALPIRAVLLARLAHRSETTWAPILSMPVWREMTTSSLVYQPGMAQIELNMMADLVRRVPCYQINLGTDLERIPDAIAHILVEA